MRVFLILVLTCLSTSSAFSQSLFWVSFTDKGTAISERLADPAAFLGSEAIRRRQMYGIEITTQDLPVCADYLFSVKGHAQQVLMFSRWFNAALIKAQPSELHELRALSFVKSVKEISGAPGQIAEIKELAQAESFGKADVQNRMINIPEMHSKGWNGAGIRMAILDAGFPGVDTLSGFDSLRKRNGIVATYDFVDDTSYVYGAASHGTRVLSTIAAYLPGEIIGSAPGVDVMLFRTEDARRELQVEEFYWLAAVEMADSLGVDIIHSSLGYNAFQDSPGYQYEDLNGDRAIVTRAGDWAAARGILVVTSAGNEGNKSWHYLTAPCDGDSILCVGSVTRWRDLSDFSSVGPSADGRIKPDVVAMGTAAATYGPAPRVQLSNGTSFAAPIVAGLSACLWQAHRSSSNMEILQAIRLSADQAGLPDSEVGYGIPNVMQADSLLSTEVDLFSLTIAQRQKPVRGREAMEARSAAAASHASSGLVSWRWDANTIIIVLPSENIQVSKVSIKKGDLTVLSNPDQMSRTGKEIRLNTERWLPGEYEITIDALTLKDKVIVQVPRM
ncbi:MAG: S8 family serine peptidase [Bacteroidia bacterium]|nr:S8 family serine peptidase [Bacteroidia bacterium]